MRRIGINSSLNVGWNSPWWSSASDVLFVGNFIYLFITDSISLLVICSYFLTFPDLVLEDCMFLGVDLFLINCLICWCIIVCSSHFGLFAFLWKLLKLLFHFLFIWTLFFFLRSLTKDLLSLSFFSILLRICFTYCHSNLDYFLLSVNIGFWFSFFMCKVRGLFEIFLASWISLLELLLMWSIDFGTLCFHFHLLQGIFWLPLWFLHLTHWLLSSMFTFYMSIFCSFFMWLISGLIVFLNLLRLVLWPSMWSVLEDVSHAFEMDHNPSPKEDCTVFAAFGWNVLRKHSYRWETKSGYNSECIRLIGWYKIQSIYIFRWICSTFPLDLFSVLRNKISCIK